MPRDESTECNSFDADGELDRTSPKYDITAIGALFCRHGYIGWALNCFSGERFSYALFVVFLCAHKMALLFFWYDVNCRFKSRATRWLKGRLENELHVPRGLAGSGLPQFPLPPFHRYMHSAVCQIENEATSMKGSGRPPGEPPEQKWSVIGQLGAATQYMTPMNRQGRLERMFHWMEQESDCKHSTLLMRFAARTYEAV